MDVHQIMAWTKMMGIDNLQTVPFRNATRAITFEALKASAALHFKQDHMGFNMYLLPNECLSLKEVLSLLNQAFSASLRQSVDITVRHCVFVLPSCPCRADSS